MNYADLLKIILSSTVISTCVTTFLSPILELIKSKHEKNRIDNERQYNDEKEEKQKRKEIYANAIHIIQLIKNGFYDRTHQQISNMPFGSSQIKEKYEELNNNIKKINDLVDSTIPWMSLYATDEIYELFSSLTKYSKFSYSKNVITQFILYSFDREFAYMCKAMQKNLGLRFDTPKLPEPHICPYCGTMHDSEEVCPFCAIPWVDAVEIEDKFNEDCEKDERLQQLLNDCICKHQDPSKLMPYPINKDKWIEQIEKFLNISV